jgi:hypothetical protein
MAEWHRVMLDVRVWDRKALFLAAQARAKADGMSRADYLDLRRAHVSPIHADLQMLFDPGVSPNGCTIDQSEVESQEGDDYDF